MADPDKSTVDQSTMDRNAVRGALLGAVAGAFALAMPLMHGGRSVDHALHN